MRRLLCSCLITVALGLSPVVALGDEQSHRKAAENLLLVLDERSPCLRHFSQCLGDVVGGHALRPEI